MRTVLVERFIVPKTEVAKVESRLFALGAEKLMEDDTLFRVLFRDVRTDIEAKQRWIRVRVGDVDGDGDPKVRLTYKLVEPMGDVKVERSIDLGVDNMEECVELLESMGLTSRSEQETKRTKYSCFYDESRYVLNFDTWPWLEHLRFVSVQPCDEISKASLEDFCDRVGLSSHRSYKGGVDRIYKEEYNFELMEVSDVRFGIPVPSPREPSSRLQ